MKRLIYTAFMLLTFVSCDQWFDVEPKGEGTSGNGLFNNEASFRDYMNGIYADLRSRDLYGGNLTLGGVEFLAQTFVPYTGAEAWTRMDFNSDMARTIARRAYGGLYAAIYRCNDLLRQFDRNPDVEFVSGSREMMMAETRALRAFLHFELLRLFSPAYAVDASASFVPWIGSVDGPAVTMTSAELLDRILSELDAALVQLEACDPVVTGVGYDDMSLLGTSPADRCWKLNYYAVAVVKARALMFRGAQSDCREASTLLGSVIEKGGYEFVRTVSDSDYSFSREFIFALPSDEKGFCALSEELFDPSGKGVVLSSQISLDDLSPDDRRRGWIDGDNTMRTKFAPTSKIDLWETAPAIPMVKLGEVYLLAAEAAAKSGDLASGISRFNSFMTERNSASMVLAQDASLDQLMEAVDLQYRYEFMGEGVRLHFCKRLDKTITAFDGSQISEVGKKYLPIVQ